LKVLLKAYFYIATAQAAFARNMRLFLESGKLWPFELKLGTTVTPALVNVQTNIAFSASFVFELGVRIARMGRRDRQTGKTGIAAYYDGPLTTATNCS